MMPKSLKENMTCPTQGSVESQDATTISQLFSVRKMAKW